MRRLIGRKLPSGRTFRFVRGKWKSGRNTSVKVVREASRLR